LFVFQKGQAAFQERAMENQGSNLHDAILIAFSNQLVHAVTQDAIHYLIGSTGGDAQTANELLAHVKQTVACPATIDVQHIVAFQTKNR
jgi:hypothetical protein